MCAQNFIAANDTEKTDEIIQISKNMNVLCRYTSMIAKLKLNKD